MNKDDATGDKTMYVCTYPNQCLAECLSWLKDLTLVSDSFS